MQWKMFGHDPHSHTTALNILTILASLVTEVRIFVARARTRVLNTGARETLFLFYMPMPPIPPIPPIPPPAGNAGSSFGISVITASAVVRREATPEASVMAVRTTYTHIKF